MLRFVCRNVCCHCLLLDFQQLILQLLQYSTIGWLLTFFELCFFCYFIVSCLWNFPVPQAAASQLHPFCIFSSIECFYLRPPKVPFAEGEPLLGAPKELLPPRLPLNELPPRLPPNDGVLLRCTDGTDSWRIDGTDLFVIVCPLRPLPKVWRCVVRFCVDGVNVERGTVVVCPSRRVPKVPFAPPSRCWFTVVRVLLWRFPNAEFWRLFCCALPLKPP